MHPTFNEQLCQQVREGKLAIENTDKAKLPDLIHYIFPDDRQVVYGTSKFYFKSETRNGWCDSVIAVSPSAPVSDFYLPVVKGEYKDITGWNTKEEHSAYDKGREHENDVIITWIKDWDGRICWTVLKIWNNPT